jgi:hypothetical protein
MGKLDLTHDNWFHSSSQERDVLSQQLAQQLPVGFSLAGIERFAMGGQENNVALYRYQDGTTFSYIPSGAFVIGFDTNAWQPNADERASWQETAEEWDLTGTIQEEINHVTKRPRTVEIAPLLVETTASELGWEPADVTRPLLQKTIKGMGKQTQQIETHNDEGHFRVTRDAEGTFVALQALPLVHSELLANLQEAGFCFPTCDEWEYLCGGGTKTLFRWGDHAPCDHYPIDKRGFNNDANAFGLSIAIDPYKNEIVYEEGITRGGDGGSAICGGSGFFNGWLPLATAYFDEHTCLYEPDDLDTLMGYLVGRRVLPLL